MSRPAPGRPPPGRFAQALLLLLRGTVAALAATARAAVRFWAWLSAEEEEPPGWASSGEWLHGAPGGLRAACLVLLVLVPLSLVGLRLYGRALMQPRDDGKHDVLTYLSRAVAAEAGGNGYCAMEAKVAVAAAMLSKVQDLQKISREDVRGHHVRRFLDRQAPNYLEGYRTNSLYDRNLDWLQEHGFSECIEAAKRALSGEDPSRGARHWYDDSIPAPHPPDVIEVTREFPTRGNRLIFYRFRPGARVRPPAAKPAVAVKPAVAAVEPVPTERSAAPAAKPAATKPAAPAAKPAATKSAATAAKPAATKPAAPAAKPAATKPAAPAAKPAATKSAATAKSQS